MAGNLQLTMPAARTVLISDDSPDTRDLVAQAFVDAEWNVETAADVTAAQARIDQGGGYEVLITGVGTSAAQDVRTLRRV
jgi:DNA-binding NtrC family response regulator